MVRKMSKEARDMVLKRIEEEGFVSTDEIVNFIRPFYLFDYEAAHERELRRYVGQLVRVRRDTQGVRTTFLEKTHSEIVDIDTCIDAVKVELVSDQLKIQSQGIWKSYKKAARRGLDLKGQVSLFDEKTLLQGLNDIATNVM